MHDMVNITNTFVTLILIVLITVIVLYNTSAIAREKKRTQFLTSLEKDESGHEQQRSELAVINGARENLPQSEKFGNCPERKNVTLEDIRKGYIPEDLYKLAPEIFDQFPKTFLSGYSSPCWMERDKGRKIRCLPKLFIAGVAKCGTTDLYLKIASHPHIIHAKEKEPSWWTRGRYDRKRGTHKPAGSFRQYLHEFDKLSNQLHQDSNADARKLITVDASPSTFWDNVFWRKYVSPKCTKGPTYVIADVIHAVLPDTKIMAVFRNPTDRLYSDYMFTGGQSRTPQTFHKHVLNAMATFNACLKSGGSLRSCVYKNFVGQNGHIGHGHLMMLTKGLYSVHAREWMYAFPREQLMFVRFEDWYSKCGQILPHIYSFLELDPLSTTHIENICAKKNPTKKKNTKGPMLNATRIKLDKFYQNSRRELAEITGDVKFVWDDWT